jgi:hypothetical protein
LRKFNLFRKKFKIFPSHFEAVSQSLFCHCERPKGAWQSQSITSRLLRRFTPRNDITTQPFSKEESIAPPFDKGRLGGILLNSRGLSVFFLVIAMMLMVAIGYVFSYLIPTKQKSVSLVVSSNQAFFIAQSGVEFAVRYASDQGWTTTALLNNFNNPPNNTRNLGKGRFILQYTPDTLTSTGEIPNASQRRIAVSNFTSFLIKQLVLDPGSPSPCWTLVSQRARFFIKNIGSSNVTLTAFTATWSESSTTRIREIYMDGTQKFFGNYWNGDPQQNLNRGGNNQTIAPNQVIRIDVYWFNPYITGNIVITFYTGTGEPYQFNLGSVLLPCL